MRTNKEIKNICAGKHSLCQWILLEHILVILSAWGTNDTYDQASPMVTTMRLVCTLLAEDKINIEKLAEMLIPSDETVSTSTKEELNELKQKAKNAEKAASVPPPPKQKTYDDIDKEVEEVVPDPTDTRLRKKPQFPAGAFLKRERLDSQGRTSLRYQGMPIKV